MLSFRKLNDQDGILCGQAYEHHQTNLNVHIIVVTEEPNATQSSERYQR
jgi:hypothetical protein